MSHLNLPEILAQWKILQVFALVHVLSPSRPSSFCFTIFLGLPRATEIFHARFPVSVKCLWPLAEDLSSSADTETPPTRKEKTSGMFGHKRLRNPH